MGQILHAVPYEVTFYGQDMASGRKVSNRWYFRCGFQNVAPPLYGQPIAGPSDNATFLTNIVALYTSTLSQKLNQKYNCTQAISQAIIGKRYSSPLFAISALAMGTPVQVTTPSPHGYLTGQTVVITGVTSPAIVNAAWVITVTSPYSFSLNGSSIAAAWSADGMVQTANGKIEFLYSDKQTLTTSIQGTILTECLPLFCTASIRRLNVGIGRHFRSRVSLSPMSEGDSLDGGFTTAQKAQMATALTGWNVSTLNGGTDPSSKFMIPWVISRQLAFALISPFQQSATWSASITQMVQQPNVGSLVRRKPKQSTIIT